MFNSKSVSEKGRPVASSLAARLTLRSAAHRQQRKFLANVSGN
jgi:hypothetical protein